MEQSPKQSPAEDKPVGYTSAPMLEMLRPGRSAHFYPEMSPGGGGLDAFDIPLYTRPAPAGGVAVSDAWQPIETAPKDGTYIDLWNEEFGRQANCYWGKSEHCCGEAGQYCDSEWHGEPETWIDADFNEPVIEPEGLTHWMPLPAPPAALSPEARTGERS